MKIKAAVTHGQGFKIEEVELAEPKLNEVSEIL
jgi:Zn-dependent alcohol dehydrogenase